MALSRFGGRSFAAIFQNASNGLRTKFQQSPRMFRLGEARLDELKDYITVDRTSKIALVVDGKYKSYAEVPDILPLRTVTRSRDRFRVKMSIASAIFVLFLCIYSIKKNQRLRREREYELMNEAH